MSPETVLDVKGMTAGYGESPVVKDLDLRIGAGEVVTLIGANGAGKTTSLLAIAGQLRKTTMTMTLAGANVTGWPTHRLARQGLAMVPDDRALISSLTVAETFSLIKKPVSDPTALFPELEPLLHRRCGLLSGGEQQMVALARVTASAPKVLLIDELSQGLAPLIVDRLLEALRRLSSETGMGVLLVEQHVRAALKASDRGYLLSKGSIVMALDAAEMLRDIETIESHYLGGAKAEA